MSAWRRRLLELFPDLRDDVQGGEPIYLLFSELAARCKSAHALGDTETLSKIYGFAEWCAMQPNKELWNPAGVSFYEHIVESELARREFPRWVSRRVFEDVAGLIEWRVGAKALAEIRKAYESG